MRRMFCLASLLVVGSLALAASSGSAGTVNWFGSCYQRGTATTAAGPLQLRLGWFTERKGQLQQFLGVQYVRYTINGVTTQTATGDTTNWTQPTPTVNGETPPKSGYVSWYTTPVLATLATGDSVTVSLVLGTTKVTQDDSAGTPIQPQEFGAGNCTITAT